MERTEAVLKRMETIARNTIEKSTIPVETQYLGLTGQRRLLVPCGDLKYPSFWLRDCAMSSLSGLLSDGILREYISIFATHGQNGPEPLELRNGLRVPAWAFCDHLNYNARPVWYPGTLSDGADQGAGAFGILPPLDDGYWFLLMAAQYVHQSGETAVLRETFGGIALLERLERTWAAYGFEEDTELSCSEDASYAVDWGFTDTVQKSGKLLFSSVLRFHAGRALAVLLDEAGERSKAKAILARTETLRSSILSTFQSKEPGWLLSATGYCSQIDVWGTLFALWCGVPDEKMAEEIVSAVKAAYLDGTSIAVHGYVRHLRTSDDARPGVTAWERRVTTEGGYNQYQDGAYWATPTGWLLWTLYKADPELALTAAEEFADHCEAHAAEGTPFEWMNADGSDRSGLWYATSAALPYLGMLRIVAEI